MADTHTHVAQREGCLRDGARDSNKFSQTQLYSIPPLLIYEIVGSIADSTRKPLQNYDKLLYLLETLKWPTQRGGRTLGRDTKAFTLGVTLNVRGSKKLTRFCQAGKLLIEELFPHMLTKSWAWSFGIC